MQTARFLTSARKYGQIGTELKRLCGGEAASQSSYGRQSLCVNVDTR